MISPKANNREKNREMTLWKQGASACFPFLARLRIIFGYAGIGIGGNAADRDSVRYRVAPRRIRTTMTARPQLAKRCTQKAGPGPAALEPGA